MRHSTRILSACLVLNCLWFGACNDKQQDPQEQHSARQTPADEIQGSPTLKADANAQGFQLELITSPHPIPLNEDFSLRFRLLDASGQPLDDSLEHIALDADMPEHGHGMKVAPVLSQDEGWIEATPLLFHMPGIWEIYVDHTQGHVTERAQLSFRVF
ncbi:MAG: hypothetical protein CMJ86_10360 [Planctomycetes bacterium]|jgi:hypothetical protein|nr:hypothetical protein [Planctomycetota bacterium]